ncbi:MAG: META domain-containing protein [Sphingobium sp.]|nr:META domain-containing protein [Sphingobium sp.]
MKKNIISLTAVSFLLTLSGCATVPASGTDKNAPSFASQYPEDNSRNNVDWAGSYLGVLPCADCEGVETIVTLQVDGGYSASSRYLGKGGAPVHEKGRFSWDDTGGIITLSGQERAQYRVGENRLFRLAPGGTPITGALASRYVLKKVDEAVTSPITEKYWKLVELRGQPVAKLDREPHLILKAGDNRVTGFGGCNNFMGSYTLDEKMQRIRFSKIASTMMACSKGMDVEQQFHEVLELADNYSINGDHMTLNKARIAPLARFEAVYLR